MTDQLTTIANVEAWLKLPSGNTDEAVLTRLISAVSGLVESLCSRSFLSTDYTETRDGKGGRRMSFANTPVTAVASVTVDGVAIGASSGFGQPGYQFSDSAITLTGYRFSRGLSNVQLAYTAGFATVPPDLEQAVLDWIAVIYREKDRIGFVSQATAGQVTAYLVKDIPPRVAAALAAYKRRVPLS